MAEQLSVENEVITALRRIARAVDLHSRLLLHQWGLTVPQLATLRMVEQLQPVTAGALARAVHLSQATVTGILTRLETRGLISRSRTGDDRRNVLIHLTENGVQLLAHAPPLLQEKFRREFGKLQQWEQTMILATLQRIATMMDAEKLDAASVLEPGEIIGPQDSLPHYGTTAAESTAEE